MWIAVCADKQCQWERGAFSEVSAQAQLAWHAHESHHRGAAVDVPAPDLERCLELRRADRQGTAA